MLRRREARACKEADVLQHWFTYPNIDAIAFRIGPIPVHWYGLSYIFGFLCVYLWMSRPAGRRRLGLTAEAIQDFMLYSLVGVLLGGRTVFVISDMIDKHNAAEYFSHPLNLIAVWNGGMAFHGGLAGVLIAIYLFARKHPGLTFPVLADEVVMLGPVAIATTRLVNFINDELPGRVCNPDQPWCIKFPAYDGFRYPSQIMEGILDLLALPVLFFLYRRRPADGVVAWTWFIAYGVARTIADFWRDPTMLVPGLGLTPAQLLSIGMIVVGVIMVVRSSRNNPHTWPREEN